MLVVGRDVRPRRAAEAFWRCEQALARRTRDIFGRCEGGNWELSGWSLSRGGRWRPRLIL